MGYNYEDLLSDEIAVKISEEWMFEQLEMYFRDYCRKEVISNRRAKFFGYAAVVIMLPLSINLSLDECTMLCASINDAYEMGFKIIEFEETECYEIYSSKIEEDYVDDFENILFDF